MAAQVRYLRQMVSHLREKYGDKKAEAIATKAQKRYDELIEENKNEPKEYYMHTRERIYPSIALFDALLAVGVERKEAEDFVTGYYRWRAGKMVPMIKTAFKIPGLYKLVPKIFFKMTNMSFGPKAGFASENAYLGKDEMRFDMVKCPYYDNCLKYGCPEITKGFCDADDICYGNMHPKVSWDRTKTIGRGDGVCDFKVHLK
ncbi:MAG: L-2-amino-thiazoline-4-carboxylic acid hydrolase [Lachnospiraceae bacterium]|nr:L-2-amino-thiazoline-4-carboxylic acid hydrolase [Lachnospiraceae bacterium]